MPYTSIKPVTTNMQVVFDAFLFWLDLWIHERAWHMSTQHTEKPACNTWVGLLYYSIWCGLVSMGPIGILVEATNVFCGGLHVQIFLHTDYYNCFYS